MRSHAVAIRWGAVFGAVALLAASCGTGRSRDPQRLSAGTVRASGRDGREIWATPKDRRLGRFHFRDRGGEGVLYDSPAHAPSTLPTGISRMVIVGAGLIHRPDWLPTFRGGVEQPQFAVLRAGGRVEGSWILETDDAPDSVRRFYADALSGLGFTIRYGPPPTPEPRVLSFFSARDPRAPRLAQVRVERGGSRRTRAEISYSIGTAP